MTRFPLNRWIALLGCSAALAVAQAAGPAMSKEDAAAEKARIEADYKAQRTACDSLSGNAKDICVEEAKGKEKVAKAELDYKREANAKNEGKVAEARAEATYAVAKERCDDLAGDQKDVCVKEAKAAKSKAEANAKATRKSTAG